ncbi:hypothetical protein IJG71_02585 [Candidatus Saccharibacteria bacterium]|nr:hypothetical protein [Candidatus Saccharibacteria bacterium]
MFWVFAGALLIMLLGLRCIEKGNKISRILALIGLGFGVVGLILELALIWELFPLAETAGFYSYNMTVMGKLTVLVMATMIVAIGSALIMRIKESDKLVRILKWVAIGCGCGLWVITVIIIFANDLGNVLSKILGVSGVLMACFMVCWITALIMSRFNRKEEDSKPEVEVKKEVEVENVIVEPVKNEPIQAESTQVELAQVESVKIEPVQVEPVQAEPVQAELDPLQSFQNEGSEPSAAPHDTNV